MSHHQYSVKKQGGDIEHINALEFYPILAAAKRWGGLWRGRRVCMITDNTAVMHAINSGRSKSKKVMTGLRELFWLSITFNYQISSVYIKSANNIVCDRLSRLNDYVSLARIRAIDKASVMCCSEKFIA